MFKFENTTFNYNLYGIISFLRYLLIYVLTLISKNKITKEIHKPNPYMYIMGYISFMDTLTN